MFVYYFHFNCLWFLINVKCKKQCKKFNISATHKILKSNFQFDTKFKNNSNCSNATSWKHFQIDSKYSFVVMGPISLCIFVNFPFFLSFRKMKVQTSTIWSLKHILIGLDKTFIVILYIYSLHFKVSFTYTLSLRDNLAYSWMPSFKGASSHWTNRRETTSK